MHGTPSLRAPFNVVVVSEASPWISDDLFNIEGGRSMEKSYPIEYIGIFLLGTRLCANMVRCLLAHSFLTGLRHPCYHEQLS